MLSEIIATQVCGGPKITKKKIIQKVQFDGPNVFHHKSKPIRYIQLLSYTEMNGNTQIEPLEIVMC